MFKPEKDLADLNCEEIHQVKGFVGCRGGYFRITIVLEDGWLEFAAAWLSEVDILTDLHLMLDTAN